ncbi:hypothetical protein, partial [Enterobacter hormaechei]|uniref:hypothetical protein n=1 Tax=Enterobacter hormaechei TaxID=158836 RepID=UPI0019546B63
MSRVEARKPVIVSTIHNWLIFGLVYATFLSIHPKTAAGLPIPVSSLIVFAFIVSGLIGSLW